MNKISIEAIKKEAEKLYDKDDYFCSEAIIATIRKHFAPDMPEQAIAMGSGFPVGVGGARCMCGAVSGGVMMLGYFFGRVQAKDKKVQNTMDLSKELHDYFQNRHKVLCCRVLTKDLRLGSPKHKKQCVMFTGEIAAKTAEIIARELGLDYE
jgi:C_GCAxxG_C_C family probable redox protein